MNYGLYLSASAMRINEYRHDVLANNLANQRSIGFKRDVTVVRARESAPKEIGLPAHLVAPVLDDVRGGLLPDGTHTDFSQGPLERTGRPLDLALQGEGFFAVEVDGQKRYTRDGRFNRSNDGFLVTSVGAHRVLDANDSPIQLPAGDASVNDRGTVTVGGVAAQLKVVAFDDPSVLQKTGGNMFTIGEQTPEAKSSATVRSQFLEGSGVDEVKSLVEMLSAQRAYEASAKLVQFSDTMLGRAVNDIARLG